MNGFHELVAWMRMETGERALRDEVEATRRETEEALLFVLR